MIYSVECDRGTATVSRGAIDRIPIDRDSVYPNGIDRTWTLYFCSNGSNRVLLTGELPEHWWDWSVDDRYHYIQNL